MTEVNMGCAGIVDLGCGNHVVVQRVVAIAAFKQPAMSDRIDRASESGVLINLSGDQDTKSILFLDDQSLILTALQPQAVASLISKQMLSEVVVEL